MPTFNINQLQNKNSGTNNDWKSFFENFSIEALANLGQRFGISADGIKYHSFNMFDILDTPENYDASKHIAKFNYSDNSTITLTIIDKETGEPVENISNNYETDISLSRVFIIDDAIEAINNMPYIINGLEEYKSNSIIVNDIDLFTCILKGKFVDAENDDYGKLIYFQYDKTTNKLTHLIYTQYFGNFTDSNRENKEQFILYQVDYNSQSNKYIYNIYLFTIETIAYLILNRNDVTDELLTDLTNNIKMIYKYSSEITDENNIEYAYTIFNKNFVDYQKLIKNPYDNNGIDSSDSSFIQFIVNEYEPNSLAQYDYGDKIISIKGIELEYDDETGEFNKPETLSQDQQIKYKKLIGYIDNDDINDLYITLSNINLLYYKLLQYYNAEIYNKDLKTLYRRILIELYTYIHDAEGANNDSMFVPLDYDIHFACNGNKATEIYYSNNIFITYTSYENNKLNSTDINKYNNIIYNNPDDYVNVDHSAFFVFETNYNKDYIDIINSISVIKIFSLPYINKNNQWVINDVDTNIEATGNINSSFKTLMIYYKNANTTPIILNNSIYEDEIGSSYFEFIDSKFTINPHFFATAQKNVECKTKIPKITSENIEFFKNTLIILITNSENIVNSKEYPLEYVYSMWTVNNINNEYVFDYVKDFENTTCAFDPFNNTSFIDISLSKYNRVNSLYIDTNKIVQDNGSANSQYWAVVRNKVAKDYNEQYNNLFNYIIEYVVDLNVSGSNINYETKQNEKYIKSFDSLEVTNVLYPKSNVTTVKGQDLENLKVTWGVENQEASEDTDYMALSINNEIVESVKTVAEAKNEISKLVQKDAIPEEIDIYLISKAGYYNEYTFNSNVPTFDGKEILFRNINTLNRSNILGISNDAIYYGYIGTSYDNNDKSTLYITTSQNNINIGNDTLLNPECNSQFKTFDTLEISGFNNIKLDAKETISLSSQSMTPLTFSSEPLLKKQIDNIEFNTKQIIPTGKFYKSTIDVKTYAYCYSIYKGWGQRDSGTASVKNLFTNTENNNWTFIIDPTQIEALLKETDTNKLFVRFNYTVSNTVSTNKKQKLFDTIYLNKFIQDTYDIDISDNDIKSLFKNQKRNIIIKITYNSKYYYFLMINDILFNNEQPLYIVNSILNVSYVNDGTTNQYQLNFNDGYVDCPSRGDHYTISYEASTASIKPVAETDNTRLTKYYKNFDNLLTATNDPENYYMVNSKIYTTFS